jgi:hypothetical protein
MQKIPQQLWKFRLKNNSALRSVQKTCRRAAEKRDEIAPPHLDDSPVWSSQRTTGEANVPFKDLRQMRQDLRIHVRHHDAARVELPQSRLEYVPG